MSGQRSGRAVALALAAATLLAGCAGSSTTTQAATPPGGEVVSADATGCADVIDVAVTSEEPGVYRFDVTLRSPDTGWDKYADQWEVRAPDGTVLGERLLTHPHVEEQPFTRSQSGIRIPDGLRSVTVAARDSVEGFCGRGFQIDLP